MGTWVWVFVGSLIRCSFFFSTPPHSSITLIALFSPLSHNIREIIEPLIINNTKDTLPSVLPNAARPRPGPTSDVKKTTRILDANLPTSANISPWPDA